MAADVFEMIFVVVEAIIDAMKSVSFLGVSVFHWSVGFLIMGAVITYLLNTVNSSADVSPHRKEKD